MILLVQRMLASEIETRLNDPLGYLTPLAYAARYYPLGFPADIASNSPEVLEMARESWGVYQPRFDRLPIQVRVMVQPGGELRPPAPVVRGQRHLLMWVADRENFAVCDWRERFACAFITDATAADRVFCRWHFLDSLIYMLLELNYFTALHAAAVAWKGSGVLLYGESGMGKSTLSYACARRGWTYISDDGSCLVRGSRSVIGEPHHFRFRADAPEIFPELRGLTVGRELERKPTIEVFTANLPIQTAPECRVDHIVFLSRGAGLQAGMYAMASDAVRERLLQDIPTFDPELQERRMATIESITAAPGFELRYAEFGDAVDLLEALVSE